MKGTILAFTIHSYILLVLRQCPMCQNCYPRLVDGTFFWVSGIFWKVYGTCLVYWSGKHGWGNENIWGRTLITGGAGNHSSFGIDVSPKIEEHIGTKNRTIYNIGKWYVIYWYKVWSTIFYPESLHWLGWKFGLQNFDRNVLWTNDLDDQRSSLGDDGKSWILWSFLYRTSPIHFLDVLDWGEKHISWNLRDYWIFFCGWNSTVSLNQGFCFNKLRMPCEVRCSQPFLHIFWPIFPNLELAFHG